MHFNECLLLQHFDVYHLPHPLRTHRVERTGRLRAGFVIDFVTLKKQLTAQGGVGRIVGHIEAMLWRKCLFVYSLTVLSIIRQPKVFVPCFCFFNHLPMETAYSCCFRVGQQRVLRKSPRWTVLFIIFLVTSSQ